DGGRWDFHQSCGMPVVTYQSQAHGLLHRLANGTLARMHKQHLLALYDLAATRRRLERMQAIGRRRGGSLAQGLLRYPRSQPFLTIPIVGCRSPAQLEDSMRAVDVMLSDQEVAEIASTT